MSEKRLRRYIATGLKKYGHICQVESHATAVGFPDTNYCFDGIEGNIELKYYGSKGYVIRKSQIAWMRQRIQSGGKVFMLCAKPNGSRKQYILLHVNAHTLDVMKSSSQHERWETEAMWKWDDRIDFSELRDLLRNKITYRRKIHED